jgi:hypothetical protein
MVKMIKELVRIHTASPGPSIALLPLGRPVVLLNIAFLGLDLRIQLIEAISL